MGNPITGKIVANNIGSSIGTWRYLSGPSIASISSPTSSTSDVSNLLNGIYFFEWKVSNGQCPPNLDTLKLSIFNPLLASISSSQTLCSGQTPTLLSGLAPTGGSGIYAYQWQQSADGISFTDIAAANAISYQPPLLTVNTWYRRITLSGNCNSFSNIVSITVQPSILNNTISPNAAICIGSNSPTIVGTSVIGGNGVYHYQWQKYSAGLWVNLTAVDTLANYSPGALGSTTIFRRLVTSGFCSGPQTSISNLDTIKVYPLPVVNAGVNYSKCSNQPKYKLVGSPTGGIWSGTYVNNDSLNPSTTPIGVYSLIYSYSDSNGCGNSDTVLLSIIAPPVVAAGSDFSICENAAPIQLTGFNPSTGGTWSGQGVSTSGLFNPSVTGSGTFSLIYSFMAGSGCNGSDTLIVTVYPKPNPNFVLPSQKCAKDTFQINVTKNPSATINSYLWQVTNSGAYSNAILSSNTIQNPIGTFPENQSFLDVNYTLKVITITDQGCVDSITKPIILRRRPFALFSTGSNIDCGPASYSIINGTNNVLSNYLWSTNPSNAVIINTSTSTNPNITLPLNTSTTALSYQVKLIATRNDGMIGCTDTAIQSLVVYPKPDAEITLNSTGGCSPLTVSFTNNSDPKNGESISSMSFRWVFDIFPIDTNRDQTKTFYNTGVIDSVRNIRLISTSKWGCKDTADTNVTIYPFPKSSFTSTIYSSCAPFLIGSANLSLQQFSSANDTYTWEILNKSLGIISTITGTNIPTYTIINPDDTVYYRLISSNVHGCKPDTLIRMFRTIPNPVPSYSMSDSAGCSPLVVNFTNTSTAGVSSNWTFSNGAISGVTNPFPITFTNSSHTVNALFTAKLVITAGTGCKDSITDTIRVYPKPLASFNVTSPICANTSLTPSNNSVKKAGLVDYGWKFISPNTSSSISDTAAFEPLLTLPDNQLSIDTSYNIRLRVTSVDACVHDTSKQILVQRRPKALFTLPQPQCGPASITANNGTNNVGSNWLWSVIPTTGVSFNNSSVQNPVLTFAVNNTNDSINYRVKLTATRAGSTCFDTASNIVSIYPKPQAQFTSLTLDSCGPRMVNFTNTSNAKNGETLGSMSFNWTFLGNNIVTTHASGNFVNALVNDSNYAVRLIVSSKHGCKDTTTQTVIVRPDAKAVFTQVTKVSCAPFVINSLNVIAIHYPNANNIYSWFINGNYIGNGLVFPGYTISNPNDSILIKLKTISKNGCKDDSMAVWFRTIPNPVPSFSMSDSAGCSPLVVSFNNTSIAGVSSSWTFSNGAISGVTNPFPITFTNSSHTVNALFTAKLVITAGTGCKDSITDTIRVYPKPLASFNVTSPICANTSLTPSNNSVKKAGLVDYGWKFISPNTSSSISDTAAFEPLLTLPDNQLSIDTSYNIRLRVTSVDACVHDTSKQILVQRRPKALFTLPQPQCGPASITANNGTNNVGSNWLWSVIPTTGVSFNNSSVQNPVLTFAVNNTNDSINYRVKLTATRAGSTCFDTASNIVSIYPKPQAQFTSLTLDSCGPRMVNFTNTSNAKNGETLGSMSCNWTFLGNNIVTSHASGNFVNALVNDSSYAVRLLVSSKHGCKDTTTQTVIVRPDAKAVFNRILGTSCAPFIINSSNITAQNYSNANSLYEWFKDGVFIGNGIVFPGVTILSPSDSALIKLRTTSKNGCKQDSMEMWFYTIENPKPNFIAIDSVACSGISIQFQNTSSPINGLTYKWEFGQSLDSSNLKNPSRAFLNYGTLDTTLIVKLITTAGGTGCKDSISKFILIKPLPNPDFALSDSFVCYPKSLNVLNTSAQIPPINLSSYKWDVTPLGATILNDTTNSQTSIYFADNQSGIDQYYQVKLTNLSNFGCKDSLQKRVRIPSRPISNFNFNLDSNCGPAQIFTNNTSLFGVSYFWSSLKPGANVTNSIGTNTTLVFPAHFGLLDSIYPIKLLVSTGDNCMDSMVKNFKVFPNPISKFVSNIDNGCSPLPIIFFNQSVTKKPPTYYWNYGDGTSLVTSMDTINKTFVGSVFQDTTFIARLVSVSVNGCKDTVYKPINVLASAVANITLDDTLICSNANIPTRLKINNLSYGSVDTFYWDFGDGASLMTTRDTAIFHPYLNEGKYMISLKAINSCRISYDSAFVIVQVPPIVNFSKTDSVGCSPLDVSFSNLSTNTYLANFNWTFGNGNVSSLFNPPMQTYLQSILSDTFYYIKLNVSNVCGNFPKFDTVRVLPKPTAIFSTNTTLGCSPLVVYFNNLSQGIPQNFKWDFGNGDTSNRFQPEYKFNPITYYTLDTPTIYKVRLVVSNICGVDSMTKYITVLPNTVKSFFSTSTQSGCQSLTVKFRDMSTGGSNISWNFGDGGTSSDSSPIHTFNQPGKYTVYQYVNNNCSFDTSSVIIYVYPSPNFSISKMAGNICLNQPVQFNSFLSDSGSIVWYFGDGDSSQSYHPQHAYLLPGKKVFYAIVTSNFNACKSIRVDSLVVESAPIISISTDTTRACLYHQFSFNITSNGNHYYTWDFADSNYSIGANASYTFKKPGSYLVKVIGKSILGCIDSTYKLIDVWPIPLAQFDYSPKDTCNGPAWVQFTNLSLGANSYLWDFGNGNTSTTTNATQFYSGIGKYSIQLIAGNTYFCYDTTAHDFEIFSKPEPDFTVDSRNNCKGGIVKFTNTSKFGNRYYWDFGDGQNSTEEHPSHQYDSVGVFNVKLVAFAGVVCSDSISKSNLVTIHPPPDASFLASLNDNVKPYRNFIFTANAANQMRYDWDFEYNEIRTGKIVEFGYSEKDTLKCRMVYLKVTSPFGCTDTSSQMVCLSPYWNGLFVPNAFTPEYGEGDVRVFKPIGIELKSYHVKVFNKWGELVWESTALLDGKPAIGWDGTNMNDGANCMQGSYIWTIEATFTNGENWEGMLFPGSDLPAKKGNVTLIR
ncbi:MAG: PKD domain-containing protein [Bacteroidia bacterium]|nr:PKD domain-containing protein [Bacteroidia bacterium]